VLSNFTALDQYEPYYASSKMETDRNDSFDEALAGGTLTRAGTTPVDGSATNAVMKITRRAGTNPDDLTQDQVDEQLTFKEVKDSGGYDQNWN
jgi:hypothetical protein